MDISKHLLDENAVQRGRPVKWIEDVVLYIAADQNFTQRQCWRDTVATIKGKPTPAEDQELSDKIIAQSVLVGWSGISMDGKELKYSVENALFLLKSVSRFREFVNLASKTEELFIRDAVNEAVEALKKSSTGS